MQTTYPSEIIEVIVVTTPIGSAHAGYNIEADEFVYVDTDLASWFDEADDTRHCARPSKALLAEADTGSARFDPHRAVTLRSIFERRDYWPSERRSTGRHASSKLRR